MQLTNGSAATRGLGTNQRRVLVALGARRVTYLKEAYRDTGIAEVGHVSRALSALRQRGLVEDAPLSARTDAPGSARLVRLTAAGREAVTS